MNTIEKEDIINTKNMSTKYGLIAGLLMSALLLIFQLSGNDFSPFLKLLKYTPLAIVIIIGLNAYKSSKYGLEPHALSSVLVISAILFFETFVFGNIISFCILQYLKGDRVQK